MTRVCSASPANLIRVRFSACFCLLVSGWLTAFSQAPPATWVANYNGPGNSNDIIVKTLSDAAGNGYLLAISDSDISASENLDVVVIKYNPSGTQLWQTKFNGSANGKDIGRDMVLDVAGNVYVTAATDVPGRETDFVTLKYNASGVRQWSAYFDAEKMYDEPRALTLDTLGNVYVVGFSYQKDTIDLPWEYYTNENNDFTTIKYNSAGVQQWVRHFGTIGAGFDSYDKGNDEATYVAVDKWGNVFVAGNSPTYTGGQCMLLKYSAAGLPQWVRSTAQGVGSGVGGLAVDGAGNVYLAANYMPGAGDGYADDYRFYAEKYNSLGEVIWSNHFITDQNYPAGGYNDTKAESLQLDAAGNVYIGGISAKLELITDSTGYQYYDTPYVSDLMALKLNHAGVIQWQTLHPKVSHDYFASMALDKIGNVYLTGISYHALHIGYGILKFDPNGTVGWEMETTGPSTYQTAFATVAAGPSGSLLVSTTTPGEIAGEQITTVKYGQDIPPNAPLIIGHAPWSVPIGSGVAIRGVNFTASSTVHINGRLATNVSYEGPNLIIATVPPGTTNGRIHVLNANGTAISPNTLYVGPANSIWQPKTTLATARTQHGAVALSSNGRVYAFGGTNGSELASLEVYNTNAFSWATGAPIPTSTRGAGYVRGSDNLIYVFGGYGGGGNRAQCYRYNPGANAWTGLANVPVPVWSPMTASKGHLIYLFGGQSTGNVTSDLVQIYNTQTNTWSKGAPMPVPLMQGQAVASYNGRIYLFGGRMASNGGLSDGVRIYNPDNNSWSMGPSMPVPKAQFAAVLNNDGRIFVVGGRGSYQPNVGPFFHSVEIFDPKTNTWNEGPALSSPLGGMTVVNSYGNLFVMGGIDGAYRNYNWRLVLPPVPPTTSKATAVSASEIKVDWADAAGNENRYEIERSLSSGGPWTVIHTATANLSSYINSGRAANTTYFYRVRGANSSGYGEYGPVVSAKTWSTVTQARLSAEQAGELNLQAAPNPFDQVTTITFTARETGRALLELYDLQGRKVAEVFNGEVQPGQQRQIEMPGSSLGQGIYLLRMKNGGDSWHLRLMVTR